MDASNQYMDLLDYRRSVAELYAAVRQGAHDPLASWLAFRTGRDALFRAHPQSALSDIQKHSFDGLRYYDYDPAFRFLVPIDPDVEPVVFEIALEHDGVVRIQRFGRVHFQIGGQTVALGGDGRQHEPPEGRQPCDPPDAPENAEFRQLVTIPILRVVGR